MSSYTLDLFRIIHAGLVRLWARLTPWEETHLIVRHGPPSDTLTFVEACRTQAEAEAKAYSYEGGHGVCYYVIKALAIRRPR